MTQPKGTAGPSVARASVAETFRQILASREPTLHWSVRQVPVKKAAA